MADSNGTYPDRTWPSATGVPVGVDRTLTKDLPTISTGASDDPSVRTGAVISMIPLWQVINLCVGGTRSLRANAEQIIPKEPREKPEDYERRIFHAVLPPFIVRLAAQAAGTILRKGIHLEGGDETFWEEWEKDVTGDGTPLNVFARNLLIDSLLYGHTNVVVDNSADAPPSTLLEKRKVQKEEKRKPYLIPINAQQVLGWRTEKGHSHGGLTMVRYTETVVEPDGLFGENVIEQIRVLTPGAWQVWRRSTSGAGWQKHTSDTYDLADIPFVTVYSNRLATLISRPPLLEVAFLNLAYAQRFTDYHHAIHVGAQPLLVLKGFDPEDNGEPLGTSVNTALALPPDGDAFLVEPTAAAYEAQLRCLQTLEEQISSLGVNTLARQNITNAAAEAKRLDRVDSDSIMAVISEDLARAIQRIVNFVAEYAGVDPPEVSIPKDYENKLLDGNQITAYLQLFMQGAIDQETLLRILQEGEVLPSYIDIEAVIANSQDFVEEQMAREVQKADALAKVAADHAPPSDASTSKGADQGGVASGKASKGSNVGSMTLPTPLRPGKHKPK